jgi:predicted PurR-regulated permease PerM
MENLKHSNVVFIIIYFILLSLMGMLAWPYITPIIFAGIIAGTFYPLLNYLTDKLNLNHKKAAGIVCLLIFLAIILPSVFLVMQLSREALALYEFLKTNLTEDKITYYLFERNFFSGLMGEIFQIADMEYNVTTIQNLILDTAKNVSSTLFEILNLWITNIFSFIFQFLIMMLMIYTLLVDGHAVKRFILDLSPMPDDEEELVFEKFNQMNFVTLIGNGIGGLIQGTLAGIGFWVAGIESIMLWTTSMVLLAFIPLVGISIIYVPTCIYLFIIGKIWGSVILFIYCTIISLIVENWFKPKFVGNRVKINSTLVFFSIMGGMSVFGIPGIFYGPLIVSIFLTFVNLYHKRYN